MNKSQNPCSITLTLTEACNLKCYYCYEEQKTTKTMSFKTAKRIIDNELGLKDDFDIMTIDFFGGEPFLEFDLLKTICEYVWSKEWNKEYRFFVSTNGTLIHGEIKEWLKQHKEKIWVGLSYDGNYEMQDINRCNSSDKIDLSFFAENWPTQGVKMTITPKTLPHLANGVIFLHEQGFNVNCNLAYGLDWSNLQYDTILEKQLSILINYYCSHPEIKPCSMLDMEISYVGIASQLEYTKWCGAGTSMRVYSTDGICYPCHFFEPLALGEEKAIKSFDIDFSQAVQLQDKDCNGCCLLPVCPTCYGSNYATTGDVSQKDKNICRLTKIMALANSFLKYKLLTKYTDDDLKITTERRKMLTDGIISIQKNFAL